jgi:hypothetical protein
MARFTRNLPILVPLVNAITALIANAQRRVIWLVCTLNIALRAVEITICIAIRI